MGRNTVKAIDENGKVGATSDGKVIIYAEVEEVKKELEILIIKKNDFDFDVKLNVTEFTVIFPKGSVVIRGGTRLNDEAKRLAERLKPGDKVIFTNIKSEMIGAPIKMKPAPDVVYTIQ